MIGKAHAFTPEQIAKMRYRAQTDLFYLATKILGRDRYREFPHQAVCDFFVKKDPSFPSFRAFSESYTKTHDHLMLLPRKSYKSTTKVIDNVQWLICFPEIRMTVVTAVNNLAEAFKAEFRQYFVVKGGMRDKATNTVIEGKPTIFQQLFPEFAITEDECRSEFVSPARKEFSKDPTIEAFSMEKAGSGWVCDIVDFDDAVSDQNTKTGGQLQQLHKSMAMYTKMKGNHGFRHIVGTRYHPLDPYGVLADAHNFRGYGEFEDADLKYICKPAWWLKGQKYLQPDYKTWVPNELDVDLYFAEDLPYRFLAKELKEQPEVFFSQELNDPIEASGVQFTEDLVRSAFCDYSALPRDGITFIAWDCAGSTGMGRDFSVGAVGLLDTKGEWWITEIVRGRFSHTELPLQIVIAIQKHRPKAVCIEDATGAKFMTSELDRKAKEFNVPLNIEWVSVGRGVKDMKFDRMATLHPLFTSRRIHFLNSIACLDDLMKEFQNIGNDKSRNDIPDAVSRLTTQYAHIAGAASMPPEDKARAWRELKEKEFSDLVYGKGRYAQPELTQPPKPRWMCDPVTGLPM